MKYTDLDINMGFFRNMRETEWLKLFPHWWSETDPLLQAIGKEVETIKAQAIFDLLNTAFKPPVLLWQESVIEKEYTVEKTIKNIPHPLNISNIPNTEDDIQKKQDQEIEIQAPRYKTWGHIKIINKSDILHNLQINLTPTDYIIINDQINPDDELYLDITNQKFYINDYLTKNITVRGEGLSYFKTREREEYDINQDLHNEVLKIQFSAKNNTKSTLEVEVVLKDVVFYDEQNVELNTFELIPLKSVKMFVYYDFPYNKKEKGWRQVWQKKYQENTIVLHDMITSHLFTKKFYVEVEYKGLDFSYKVGFPCIKDADEGSEYHINDRLDKWGEYFGLKRRLYRTNIEAKEYPKTFPPYYPFDIEQDYWYYKRLADEYAWNDLAINEVDIVDTNDTPVLRLHSIDPFIQDLAVHVKSTYPEEKENINYNMYIPQTIKQNDAEADYKRSEYIDLQNLLKYDDNRALITLRNYYGYNITAQKNKSKELEAFFDLSDLPENININDIKILVEAESTDNATNKYSNEETGIIIPGLQDRFFKLIQTQSYELEEKEIEYVLEDINEIRKLIPIDKNVIHTATIGTFGAKKGAYAEIPFSLDDTGEKVDDITDVYITYKGIGTQKGEYHLAKNKEGEDISYIRVFVPIEKDYSSMTISCKSNKYNSFVSPEIELVNLDQEGDNGMIYGPSLDKDDDIVHVKSKDQIKRQQLELIDEWHTGDLRNQLQKDGIKFINVYQNDDTTNIPTILIKNIRLKISYSQKNTDFDLITKVNKKSKLQDSTIVGELEVTILNQSNKEINPHVDIVCAENLILGDSNSYYSFYAPLGIGDSLTKVIDIRQTYPIIDGRYEILTTCEDKTSIDSINIYEKGLIKTRIELEQHFASYNDDITLTAKIINQNNTEMNDGYIIFKIDGYNVGEGFIDQNIATITVDKNNSQAYKYITSGLHKLQAQYDGNEIYASSRNSNFILISQYNIDMNFVDFEETAKYEQDYTIKVNIKYIDDEGEKQQLIFNDESQIVSFYIDDELIGESQLDETGTTFFVQPINYLAGTHTVKAVYYGTEAYVGKTISRDFEVIGGPTTTIVFDITAKQGEDIKLLARITDTNNKGVTQGKAYFKLEDPQGNIAFEAEVDVNKGQAVIPYTVLTNLLYDKNHELFNPDQEYIYKIKVNYVDEENIYKESSGVGELIVKRSKVIIEGAEYFYVSNHEPLGFYLSIKDVETNEPIRSGNITLSIPDQPLLEDIKFEDIIDKDGGARLLYHAINFDSKEFNRLLQTHFEQQHGIEEVIKDDQTYQVNIPYKDLICIYDGIKEDDLPSETVDELDLINTIINDKKIEKYLPWFRIIDGDLYITTKSDIEGQEQLDQVYIGKNGSLYARGDIELPDDNYLIGTYDIVFTYETNDQYAGAEKKARVNFGQGTHDISLMAYDVVYGDEDSFKCYIGEYGEVTDEDLPPTTFYAEDLLKSGYYTYVPDRTNTSFSIYEENGVRFNALKTASGGWGYLKKGWNNGLWDATFTLGNTYVYIGTDTHILILPKDTTSLDNYISLQRNGKLYCYTNGVKEEKGRYCRDLSGQALYDSSAGNHYITLSKNSDNEYHVHCVVYYGNVIYGTLTEEVYDLDFEYDGFEDVNFLCLGARRGSMPLGGYDADPLIKNIKVDVRAVQYHGIVNFYIDNQRISQEKPKGDIAELTLASLQNVPTGNHLLHTEYIPKKGKNTHTYNKIKFNSIPSTVIIEEIDRQVRGKKSKVKVRISIPDSNIRISGLLDLFLNDEKIASKYLMGIEDDMPIINEYNGEPITNKVSTYTFEIIMPEDLGTVPYTLTVKYSGNAYIEPGEDFVELDAKAIPIDITTKDKIIVGEGEKAILKINLTSDFDDYINEGKIVLYNGSNNIILKQSVKNNNACIEWLPDGQIGETLYYYLQYEDTNNYGYFDNNENIKQKIIEVEIIPLQLDVYITQDNDFVEKNPNKKCFDNFEEAQRCVEINGNIHIVDSFTMNQSIILEKNVNILGTNSSKIIKDANSILKHNSIKIHNFSEFEDTLFVIEGLTLDDITDLIFTVKNEELFLLTEEEIPIFLLEDGLFYAYKFIDKKIVNSIINLIINKNVDVKIDNVYFETNDNGENNFEINNYGNLKITKSIINKNVKIKNNEKATINRCLVYGEIVGSNLNLDNNWWGTNNPTRKLNNHIILQLDTYDIPVIGDDIEISIKFIGKNNIVYDLPPTDFYFTSETGYFSIASGQLIDGIAKTTYIDGEQEEIIYCQVDDEKVPLQIYSYDRKTEVIITSPQEVPINQQITFKVQIKSCADTFYKIEGEEFTQTEDINNGYAHFYLNDKKIGKALVKDGEAKLSIFLSDNQYIIAEDEDYLEIPLKVEYEPFEKYFASSNTENIKIINKNNVCYVSQQGNDNRNGSFVEPFRTIEKAVISDKKVIYVKEGNYTIEEPIQIDDTKIIKKYDDDVIFEDHNNIIFNANAKLILKGLIFKNNHETIINATNDLIIKECIFDKNDCDVLIKNSEQTKITRSVFIDNNDIIVNNANNEKCTFYINWFGENFHDGAHSPYPGMNDYVVMTVEQSKDKIFMGSVVRLTALLSHYNHDGILVEIEKPLPLRIAQFISNCGSLTPLKDYTYNNKSTTLFNSREDTNSDIIILKLPENKNYVNKPIILQCFVEDVFGNNINEGEVNFYIDGEKRVIKVKDGIATLNSVKDNINLERGEHVLECVYNEGKSSRISQKFIVQNLEIKVDNLTIKNGDHLNNLNFILSLVDSFNNAIDRQSIDIYIDDKYIQTETVVDGIIDTQLIYNQLDIGSHTLTFKNKDLDSYEKFEYDATFYVSKKDTTIIFDYVSISPNETKPIDIQVIDSDRQMVTDGTLDFYIDNQKYNNEPISILNGVVTLEDFSITERGQHSIVIMYNGTEYYNKSIYHINDFMVGISSVDIVIPIEQLKTELNNPLKLMFPVYDESGHLVKRGSVQLKINGIQYEDDIQVDTNGYVKKIISLSNYISTSGTYDFEVTYNDNYNNEIYKQTTKDFILDISPIKININVNDLIKTYPEEEVSIYIETYVQNTHEPVTEGIIEVLHEDQVIGTKMLSTVSDNYITLNTPLLQNGDYNITFKYVDNNTKKIYEDKTKMAILNVNKSKLDIQITPTQYYPNEEVPLTAIFKNHQDNYVKEGQATLYIDNIQYMNPVNIINGQAHFLNLSFSRVQDYQLMVVFEEDDYYEKSIGEATFKIKDVPIKDIIINNNNIIECQAEELIDIPIEIIDINDKPVTDGYMDVFINNKYIETYTITENDIDYIQFKVPKIKMNKLNDEPYELKVMIHDSTIYADKEATQNLIIQEPNIQISVDNVIADYDSTIDITVNIDINIYGTLEFYLWIDGNEDMKRFIGIEQINNKNKIILENYKLPQLETNEHIIEVKLLSNDEFNEHSAYGTLLINKYQLREEDVTFTVNNPSYQGDIRICYNLGINYNNDVDIYINDEFFATTIAVNGVIEEGLFIKKLNNNFNIGEYILRLHIDETVKLEEFNMEQTFEIVPRELELPIESIEGYIGEQIDLPYFLYDGFNQAIQFNYDEMKYKDENGNIFTEILPNMNQIYLYYKIENENFVNHEDIPISIPVIANKNNITIELGNPGPITRGKQYKPNIIINSTSHYIPNNLSITFEGEQITYQDNLIINPSINLEDKEYYELKILLEENDIFNEYKNTFKIYNQNIEEIHVPTDYNLLQAFDLIADYGTIEIDENIDTPYTDIENNKHVTINGNSKYINGTNIINNETLIINDLIIKNAASSAITTNGTLFVKKCIFEYNNSDYGGAIYIDNKNNSTIIKECTFNQNDALEYGGAIYSNKGNDIILEGNHFTKNGHEDILGASIWVNGNIYLSKNMFYNNTGSSEIYIANGTFEAENNYFDGKLIDIDNSLMYNSYMIPKTEQLTQEFNELNGRDPDSEELDEILEDHIIKINNKIKEKVQCGLNYWGYNDENEINNKLLNVLYDSYLISSYDIEYKEPTLGQIEKYITPRINQYRNKLEFETVEYENVIGEVPVLINGNETFLNKVYKTEANHNTIKIGQQELGDN